ncbi:antiviral innate immune response receptor RIG-I isoform X2 [Scleropages formosus]|uniref:antiviral innate immune response receptor RIG-I isoform X2 n=1 Tax=Scleropages formosus TaxID=113540 RepID=UPI0010FA9992|nr:probable ATP-dependent RNA helicase DDX58 isoform X2 [Scleropages formosus]
MYELEVENLKRFSGYIAQIIRPSNMRGFMSLYLDPGEMERILSEERSSVTCAAKMLLEKMWTLQEQGWFRSFLDHLLAGEYTGLHKAIEEWNFEKIEQMTPHKKLLERIEASFTNQIKPVEILTYMTECFTPRECEEIRATDEQKGHIAASEKLTECLKRSDKSNWFKLLILALQRCNYDTALQLLDPETDGNKAVQEIDMSEEVRTLSFQYKEESDVNSLVKSANHIIHAKNEAEVLDAELGPSKTKGQKILRNYQRELAEPAFDGKNTIVCAPTGCGKTLVALAICEDHLKTRREKNAKIVFLATKVEVFAQQLKEFSDYFSSTDDDVRIRGICGDMDEKTPMKVIAENNDIIVLTPQILLNALNKGELPSLSIFTLLIFDECHNTTGKHPYNMLMASYLDSKLNERGEPLPQIVGLTASVGIGTFKNQQEAENNICQLCANLDVTVISTVEQNKEELMSFVHIPEKDFYAVEKRPNDPFVSIIKDIMSTIESHARRTYDIESLSNIPHNEQGTQKYEQWIVDVQKKCCVLQMDDKEEESRVCRALFNYTEHLRKYNDALIINEDARTKDALNYLDSFFQQVRQAGFDETEQKLTAYFDAQHKHLNDLSQRMDGENPKLKRLIYILNELYRLNDKTRTLLFVKTRALAEALKNWIEETESLKYLKPSILIGRKTDTKGFGMTPTSKKGVLESFKSSDHSNILIATSVADEGIDIPQCNLVLMYEYIGNVVKMVQVRGRGRAEGSKCIFVSSKTEWVEKEKLNMHQEKIVDEAVANLQQSKDLMLTKIAVFQKEDKAKRDYIKSIPVRPRDEDRYRLVCSKCKQFACFSDDLRLLEESHHIVLDRRFFERCQTKPHGKPISFLGITKKMKVFCGLCRHDWGLTATYMNIDDLPLIKVKSFVLENCATKQQYKCTKWTEVPFSIKTFDIAEIESL